ncbi:MAG: sugar transferase [Candidatus Latescibacterota bacterium]
MAPREPRLFHAAKRVLDVVVAGALVVALAPLGLLIAALIKLDTPGPVFFVQQRMGCRLRRRGGRAVWETRRFGCLKFRSMVHNADQSLHQAHIKAFVEGRLQPGNGAERGASVKLRGDRRITRVGGILRRTSLDELPQLLNVLAGDMSLVGPRPVPLYEVAEYQPGHYGRLTSLPGITGLWQTTGRAQVSFDEMIELDLQYIRRRSLWQDLRLLALTVPAVLSGRGAE